MHFQLGHPFYKIGRLNSATKANDDELRQTISFKYKVIESLDSKLSINKTYKIFSNVTWKLISMRLIWFFSFSLQWWVKYPKAFDDEFRRLLKISVSWTSWAVLPFSDYFKWIGNSSPLFFHFFLSRSVKKLPDQSSVFFLLLSKCFCEISHCYCALSIHCTEIVKKY